MINKDTPNAPCEFDLSVALLHEDMVDKTGKLITTSLTLNDIQDLARSSCTYGLKNLFIAHPSAALRKLAHRLQTHWLKGYGSTYNTDRKEALSITEVVSSLDEAILKIDLRTTKLPKVIATSAQNGPNRISYDLMTNKLKENKDPYLLLFGTGWGMSKELLDRADYILEPIEGPTPYNHLSVRSACAITLDRLLGS